MRVHSECLTSEILGSLKCDCRDQLEHALDLVGRSERGAVIYLRTRLPESPRYRQQVRGRASNAVPRPEPASAGLTPPSSAGVQAQAIGLRSFLTHRRWLITLAGTAGCWFLLDYAYYGNTISTPQILSLISPTASTMTKISFQLAIFVVAAVRWHAG